MEAVRLLSLVTELGGESRGGERLDPGCHPGGRFDRVGDSGERGQRRHRGRGRRQVDRGRLARPRLSGGGRRQREGGEGRVLQRRGDIGPGDPQPGGRLGDGLGVP